MRPMKWVMGAALFGALAFVPGSPAAAQLDGGCSASGSWQKSGLFVDAEVVGDEVVTVPRKDVVDWDGSVTGPPGEYSGSISIDLPPPFGEIEIDSWSGDSDTTSNFGSEDYDLPKLLPAGVEFKVVGSHSDDNGTCSGYVWLEIEGGFFDSPLSIVALAITIILALILGWMIIPIIQSIFKASIRRV